jgi:hypothetical protein
MTEIEMASVIVPVSDDIGSEDNESENEYIEECGVGVYNQVLSEFYQKELAKTKPITEEGDLGNFIRIGTDKKITRGTFFIFILIWCGIMAFVIYISITNPDKIVLNHLAYENTLKLYFKVDTEYPNNVNIDVQFLCYKLLPNTITKLGYPSHMTYTVTKDSAWDAYVFSGAKTGDVISVEVKYTISKNQVRDATLFKLSKMLLIDTYDTRPDNPQEIDDLIIACDVQKDGDDGKVDETNFYFLDISTTFFQYIYIYPQQDDYYEYDFTMQIIVICLTALSLGFIKSLINGVSNVMFYTCRKSRKLIEKIVIRRDPATGKQFIGLTEK